MNFNPIELINVLIVSGLLMVLRHRRDTVTLLLVLFVCGTFHFSFAAVALIVNDADQLQIKLHNQGSGMLAVISTLTLLSVVFSLLARQAYKVYLVSDVDERKSVLYVILMMAGIVCGYLLNLRNGDWMQLKNIVAIDAMLVLVMIGYIGATGLQTIKAENIYSWALSGLVALSLIDGIALYEILTGHSWAGTLESSGEYVYRASSTLFNPNLYAFWASLVYLACAYGMHAYREHRRMLLLGMVLASTAIYLSGSRSAGYLLLALLFLPLVLIRERQQWLPLLVLPLTMLSIYAVSALLAGYPGLHEIVLLGERFAAAPSHLANYILQSLGVPQMSLGVPQEIAVSIEGRFVGGGRDAGWLVLYQDAGWVGLGVVILAGGLLVVRGIRAYLAQPCPASVYTLTLLLYCLLTGLVMRFQIFPVWLFIGLALIICMVYWRSLVITPYKAGR